MKRWLLLSGAYVLQVEDWANIGVAEEARRAQMDASVKLEGQGASARRTVMLTLSDGVSEISALEAEVCGSRRDGETERMRERFQVRLRGFTITHLKDLFVSHTPEAPWPCGCAVAVQRALQCARLLVPHEGAVAARVQDVEAVPPVGLAARWTFATRPPGSCHKASKDDLALVRRLGTAAG